jgi:hypothetical protein
MPEAAAANPAPEELVLEYQPMDEQGQPIGKKTVIKGTSWEEIARKQITVNEMAVRAYIREKKAREAVSQPKSNEPPKELTPEEVAGKVQKIDLYLEQQRRNTAAIRFMRSHPNDYYVCDANNAAMDGYLEQNGLDYTPENYEIAFAALSDSLAQSPAPPAPEANPAPAPKPRATPDIVPGSFNGAPAPKPKGLTKADYLKMAVKDPKEYQRHMTNTVLRRALDKALSS